MFRSLTTQPTGIQTVVTDYSFINRGIVFVSNFFAILLIGSVETILVSIAEQLLGNAFDLVVTLELISTARDLWPLLSIVRSNCLITVPLILRI